MMYQSINNGDHTAVVGEHGCPFAKGFVGGDYVELDCQVYVGFPFEIYSGVGFSLRRSSN